MLLARNIRHQEMHRQDTREKIKMAQTKWRALDHNSAALDQETIQYNNPRLHKITTSFCKLKLLAARPHTLGHSTTTLFYQGSGTGQVFKPRIRPNHKHTGRGLVALRTKVQLPRVLFHSPCLTPRGAGCRGVKQQLRIKQFQIAASAEHECRQKQLNWLDAATVAHTTAPAAPHSGSPIWPHHQVACLAVTPVAVVVRHKHLSESMLKVVENARNWRSRIYYRKEWEEPLPVFIIKCNVHVHFRLFHQMSQHLPGADVLSAGEAREALFSCSCEILKHKTWVNKSSQCIS